MLNLNPTSLMFDENGRATPFGAATIADINYTVRVTALALHCMVLGPDAPPLSTPTVVPMTDIKAQLAA